MNQCNSHFFDETFFCIDFWSRKSKILQPPWQNVRPFTDWIIDILHTTSGEKDSPTLVGKVTESGQRHGVHGVQRRTAGKMDMKISLRHLWDSNRSQNSWSWRFVMLYSIHFNDVRWCSQVPQREATNYLLTLKKTIDTSTNKRLLSTFLQIQ